MFLLVSDLAIESRGDRLALAPPLPPPFTLFYQTWFVFGLVWTCLDLQAMFHPSFQKLFCLLECVNLFATITMKVHVCFVCIFAFYLSFLFSFIHMSVCLIVSLVMCECLSVYLSVCLIVCLSRNVCFHVSGPNCLRELCLSSIQDGTDGAFFWALCSGNTIFHLQF